MTDEFRKTMTPVLVQIAHSSVIIRLFQAVSKGFNEVVNDPEFQYALLVKLEGSKFSGDIFKRSPRKFLRLNRDMSKLFRDQARLPWRQISNEVTALINKRNATINLISLEERRFCIFDSRNANYFTLSERVVKFLKEIDDTDLVKWQTQCVYNLVYCMMIDSSPDISDVDYKMLDCTIF
jgi:hypothetical protein